MGAVKVRPVSSTARERRPRKIAFAEDGPVGLIHQERAAEKKQTQDQGRDEAVIPGEAGTDHVPDNVPDNGKDEKQSPERQESKYPRDAAVR